MASGESSTIIIEDITYNKERELQFEFPPKDLFGSVFVAVLDEEGVRYAVSDLPVGLREVDEPLILAVYDFLGISEGVGQGWVFEEESIQITENPRVLKFEKRKA